MANNQKKFGKHCGIITAIALMAAVAFASSAYSQSQHLTITTDKAEYSVGDTIMIRGTISSVQDPTPVIIQIFNSENTAISTNVPVPDGGGKYSVQVATDGWENSGTYVVHVTYADEDQEVTFEFTGLDSQPPKENLLVSFSDGTSRIVDARLSNGVVTGITAVEESATLLFSVATDSTDGEFIVILPRELIDSKYELDEAGLEEENNFMVLADGDYADYNETSTTADDRTLAISIPAGTEEVMIGGSSMIPEFPQIVALLASVSILSLIAFNRLGKTRFLD